MGAVRQKAPRLLPAPGVSLASVQTLVRGKAGSQGEMGPAALTRGCGWRSQSCWRNLSFRPLGGAAASPDTEPKWLHRRLHGKVAAQPPMLRNKLPRTRWKGTWICGWNLWSDSGAQRGGSPCPGRASAGGTGRLQAPDGSWSFSPPSPAWHLARSLQGPQGLAPPARCPEAQGLGVPGQEMAPLRDGEGLLRAFLFVPHGAHVGRTAPRGAPRGPPRAWVPSRHGPPPARRGSPGLRLC